VKTIDVEGGHLACWDVGSGHPLVVIHGTGTPGELWRADLLELDRICRVITYDRRGYGESSPSTRDWAVHRDDAATLIDRLGAAPAVILGYSTGAIPAVDLALERPDLVSGLVLMEPALYIQRSAPPALRVALARTRLLRRVRGEREAAESWVRHISEYSTGGSAWEKAVPGRREAILANAGGVLADLASGDGRHIDERRLAGIEVPVTIVEGALGPPEFRRAAERLRGLMPRARVVTLSKSGHIVMLDARHETLDVLRRAVTEPARTSRRTG
jgi:pimeloyl-ACP methyl ester carboxylesterase